MYTLINAAKEIQRPYKHDNPLKKPQKHNGVKKLTIANFKGLTNYVE